MLSFFIFLLLIALAFSIYSSASISSGVYVDATCKFKTQNKEIALTFDDGPDRESTPLILDLLEQNNIKAVFFCIGNKIENNKDIVNRMVASGHVLGNHTYSHKNTFPILSKQKMYDELELCDTTIENVTGYKPNLFRPPFGVTNPRIANVVKSKGYQVMGWNIRSFDTCAKPEKAINRVINRIKPGSIILFHDDRVNTVQILKHIIDYARVNNYTFVLPN